MDTSVIDVEQLTILAEIADTLTSVGVLLAVIVADRKRERRATAYAWGLITWLIASQGDMTEQPPRLGDDD